MTTHLAHEIRYAAPLDQVAAMLGDPAYREAVCDAQKVVRRTVTVSGEPGVGTGREVIVDRAMSAQGIPSFAKKLVGEEIQIVQREQWASESAAGVEVTIPGKPGSMSGQATLTEDAGSTVYRMDLDISVSIPFVGGKVEQLVRDLMLKALAREERVGTRWLAR
ncbi:DUF2505 domain-containing protein [Nocardioides insulae]|uniref:DUF2505 domain-containing protein n=1 Tax=Nocardioides insulae TaxID=394734 RepID=UPI00146BC31F|nr:DUF2505 domain-containing protein [Nocardioides insulae]